MSQKEKLEKEKVAPQTEPLEAAAWQHFVHAPKDGTVVSAYNIVTKQSCGMYWSGLCWRSSDSPLLAFTMLTELSNWRFTLPPTK